jgi:hypothetical protein
LLSEEKSGWAIAWLPQSTTSARETADIFSGVWFILPYQSHLTPRLAADDGPAELNVAIIPPFIEAFVLCDSNFWPDEWLPVRLDIVPALAELITEE